MPARSELTVLSLLSSPLKARARRNAAVPSVAAVADDPRRHEPPDTTCQTVVVAQKQGRFQKASLQPVGP
jgi:hypothetical protein